MKARKVMSREEGMKEFKKMIRKKGLTGGWAEGRKRKGRSEKEGVSMKEGVMKEGVWKKEGRMSRQKDGVREEERREVSRKDGKKQWYKYVTTVVQQLFDFRCLCIGLHAF